MSGSYEKSVKGATKIKLAPPKAKYIEHILQATRAGEPGVQEIFQTLQFRLRDSTWTIAFKALIVTHIMIREGNPEATLGFLAMDYRRVMAFSTYTDVQTQGKNIRTYSTYLVERARSYGKTKQDYVGSASNRLKRLSVDKGLLRETESVQEIIGSLVKCDLFSSEPENEITLTAFRLLTMDLLTLFQVMNEGTINILEHYFEMSKPDAERALAIYKTFSKQTDKVVRFLQTARAYEYSTRLEIPKIKHAPTSLAASLEDYLNDRDFETNRRQYLAQQEAKSQSGGGGGGSSATSRAFGNSKQPSALSSAFPDPSPSASQQQSQQPARGPAPDMIDFFSSIEQNQQPMAQNPQQFQQQQQYTNPFQQMQQQQQQQAYAQQPGLVQQQTNPFGQFQQPSPIQTQPTGAGFGGYTPQPQPQSPQGFQQTSGFVQQQPTQGFPQQPQPQTFTQQQQSPQGFTGMSNAFSPSQMSPQQFMPQHTQLGAISEHSQQAPLQAQQTSTNPFRASTMPIQQTGGTNPFARSSTMPQQTGSPFSQQTPFSSPPPPMPQSAGTPNLTPQRTGTNPFAKPTAGANLQPGALVSQATGSTNPFRQSAFVNHTTGTGWQAQQGTMGGLEQLETTSVFPRPGQAPQQPPGHMNGSFGGWA